MVKTRKTRKPRKPKTRKIRGGYRWGKILTSLMVAFAAVGRTDAVGHGRSGQLTRTLDVAREGVFDDRLILTTNDPEIIKAVELIGLKPYSVPWELHSNNNKYIYEPIDESRLTTEQKNAVQRLTEKLTDVKKKRGIPDL
jgi:hypothetical protein